MSIATDQSNTDRARVRSAAVLAIVGLLAFTLPLVGFVTSLFLPVFAARSRSRLWPGTSPVMGHVAAALAVIGLWLPAVLAMATSGRLGSDSTTWLLIPLCAPAGAALVVPAVSALVCYLIGTTIGAILRTPWPWVLGAWTAPLAYAAASSWLVDFACVA